MGGAGCRRLGRAATTTSTIATITPTPKIAKITVHGILPDGEEGAIGRTGVGPE